ncbi:MAG: murein hydrolase activator EnvC [Rhizobiaceae bacterium]|nr:murein hydrolase activator EnvC [Rhizobiaceae bacterium]
MIALPLRNILRKPLVLGLAIALMLSCVSAMAQETASISRSVDNPRSEYDQVLQEITLSEERVAGLRADMAKLRKDDATLTAALVQSAKTEKKLGAEVEEISARLEPLKDQQKVVRASLLERRDVLAEVLGALERIGLNPPPAILVSPDDALASVRSAILLGSVVPEMRAETNSLMAKLTELARLGKEIEVERERLARAIEEQVTERQRLVMLQDEKRRLQEQNVADIKQEQARSAELAKKARTLRELIASVEREAKRKAEEEARQRKREEELASMPIPESNSLIGAVPFASLKGQVSLPAEGLVTSRFGARNGNGGVMLGDTVATQSGAIVTAPVDGTVLYAGPFRSYGQLLILDAGDGYHIVLAGLGRIAVMQGQAVLSGEPVGTMKDSKLASAASDLPEGAGPELYIEFRKDGKSVDPSPWWASRISGRT